MPPAYFPPNRKILRLALELNTLVVPKFPSGRASGGKMMIVGLVGVAAAGVLPACGGLLR